MLFSAHGQTTHDPPRLPVFALACVLLGFLTACDRPAAKPPVQTERALRDSNIVAMVGDVAITREALQNELSRHAHRSPREVLEQMIRFEAELAKARAAGYDRRPEIVADVNKLIVARFEEDQLASVAQAKPSDHEVRDYYDGHPADFSVPARVRAAVIQWRISQKAVPEKQEELKRQVEAVLTAARSLDGSGFSELVRRQSEDQATRYRGGDAGWLSTEDPSCHWEPAVVQQIFQLQTAGQCSGVIETPAGFYLARLLERKPATVLPFEEVKDRIAYHLGVERRLESQAAFFEQIKAGLPIRINAPVLDSLQSSDSTVEDKPPATPKG